MEMHMNIILLKGASQYDALRLFADEVEKGLKSLSHRVTMIDMLTEEGLVDLNKAVSKPFDFILNFNGIFTEDPGFVDFINTENVTVFSIFVDHPKYQTRRVTSAIKRHIQTFVCASHLEAADIINNTGNNLLYFLPHGGIKSDFKLKRSDFINRSNKLLYIATCYEDPKKAPWESTNNRQQALLSKVLYDGLMKGFSYEESFRNALKSVKLLPQNEQFRKLYESMFDVYTYFRAKNRFKVIKTLLDNGIEIDCYGGGNWKEMFGRNKNFSYLGALSMEETLQKMQEYKFTLNDVCFFPYGSHERTFNAMLNGSVIVNHQSHYYKEIFNGDEGVFFDSNNLDDAIMRLKDLMQNQDKAFSVASKGYDVAQNHTWKERARQIIDIYELYKD
ncbi:hypothetical protein CJP72_12800 [Citrobacter sp. NCU1]|nr:hypothetical protein [Citrobacter sp. NCU1]